MGVSGNPFFFFTFLLMRFGAFGPSCEHTICAQGELQTVRTGIISTLHQYTHNIFGGLHSMILGKDFEFKMVFSLLCFVVESKQTREK